MTGKVFLDLDGILEQYTADHCSVECLLLLDGGIYT